MLFRSRTRFDVRAYSFGPDVAHPMRERLKRGFDSFHDVSDRSDREVASMLRAAEIDIAIDLKGYTDDCRPGIFALRPAPVQIAYLGYPGTMGAPYFDYVIADATVIPPGHEGGYSEKIIRMPYSYQANEDRKSTRLNSSHSQQSRMPSSA